ncbi:type I-MYXAN CRISPR-associated protein Cas6/Cmx6 [Singulisphaera acidiphila]|uniref:CRISPR-associated protein Cas6, subtype MYXAN n=1 Tax=Singulisphaera acidiphila (strain ATCC BAA-1392 / DSM 18658 / VKM B-2454 / MOB10) TaxID=886293 RepID=L0D6C1_SINAD|nr:type I-MYXAN CRISPR-associated protein Cas6/Cmx6 [Singulisphaera acidiphila]AGA24812.1 CRISPR-associated protein Cas6, subtype MYXAN [Singulisphaera acidiphila DSM 18658]
MPIIDLSFNIIGTTIPLDHGYSLFSALCRVVPQLHGDTRIGVHPIRGRQTAPGVLSLIDSSRIRLRLPSEEIAPYIAVAGTELELVSHRLQVGIPRVECLTAAASLGSRLVTFRGITDPTLFETNIRRQLEKRKIAGKPSLVVAARATWTGQPMRRVLRVKDKQVIGYSLRIHGLKSEESISIQEEGLGGRRRMGCGVFLPISHTENSI